MQYSRFEPIEWLAASVLLSIFPDHSKATEKLAGDLAYEEHKKWLRTFYENSETRYTAAINLGKISSPTPEIILCLIEFISTGCIRENQIYYSGIKLYNPNDLWYKGNDFYEQASELLDAATKIISTDISKANWYEQIIKNLKICLKERVDEQNCNYSSRYEHCYRLIWQCVQNMSYTDFYQAWHKGEPSRVQPLENQFIHLQPTDKTYPIAIDTQSLKLETNTSIIAQKLCNKIYRKAGYFEIPSVNDSAQLQQEISRIQQKLHKPNLALILHRGEPHEELINLCYTLADKDLGIYICLLTSKPTEEPIKGIIPNQPNLLSAIQSWIEEIG